MALVPVPNAPGRFRDSDTGQIFDIRDYRGSDFIFPLDNFVMSSPSWQPEPEVSVALQAWSFLMYPWPEVIPVTLRAELYVNGETIAEGPLFALAEPLVRAEDEEIRERLRAVEERLKALETGETKKGGIYPVTRLKHLVNMKHKLWARIEGPDEDFVPLREKLELLALRLRGVGRGPV